MADQFDEKALAKFSKPENYSEEGFWDKVKNVAKKAGKEVIIQALRLYYIASDDDTPTWAKATIYGALAYFVLPIDLIPDALPIVGFTDDLAALAAAYKAVSSSAKPEHEQQAEDKWNEWFN